MELATDMTHKTTEINAHFMMQSIHPEASGNLTGRLMQKNTRKLKQYTLPNTKHNNTNIKQCYIIAKTTEKQFGN